MFSIVFQGSICRQDAKSERGIVEDIQYINRKSMQLDPTACLNENQPIIFWMSNDDDNSYYVVYDKKEKTFSLKLYWQAMLTQKKNPDQN